MSEPIILFETREGQNGNIGIITLNRPNQLNALNDLMIQPLYQHLLKWRNSPLIKAVVIQAVPGKAFCAGGDLRFVYEGLKNKMRPSDFFRQEYQLNLLIQQYPKPYISFLNGITMGGGAGISILGSHRIATENILFAMPETAIGFFSDVGTTYYLSRIPKSIGIYLALTGARIQAADCLHLGIVDTYVPEQQLNSILKALCENEFNSDAFGSVSKIIQSHAQWISPSYDLLQDEVLHHAFSQNTIELILNSLKTSAHEFHQSIVATLKQKSPTSLKANLRALQLAQFSDFATCLNREFRLGARLAELADFKEGIRSVIIDKDFSPQWRPNELEAISDNAIHALFKPFASAQEELIPQYHQQN